MPQLRTLKDLLAASIAGKRVLVRVDLNVPMQHGKVADATRIVKLIPTIAKLAAAGAKVILLSHFGRPKGTGHETDFSLAPIADALASSMSCEIKFGVDCVGISARHAVENLQNGDVILMENLRFHAGEEQNSPEFTKELASLGDVYVNDAFSCSHRAHASISGVPAHLPAYAGLLLEDEIKHLQAVLEAPKRPVMAVVGGSKVSTKIDMLKLLATKMDAICVGGGMANTFLLAQGHNVGKSLVEPDLVHIAKEIIAIAKTNNCQLLIPTDAVVTEKFATGGVCEVVPSAKIPADKMMLDVGPETMLHWCSVMSTAHTVVWNGPLGAYEISPFENSSVLLARYIALRTQHYGLTSVAGGGDVIASLAKAGVQDALTYVSTAGGAFLEWLEGCELPGVAALSAAKKKVA